MLFGGGAFMPLHFFMDNAIKINEKNQMDGQVSSMMYLFYSLIVTEYV